MSRHRSRRAISRPAARSKRPNARRAQREDDCHRAGGVVMREEAAKPEPRPAAKAATAPRPRGGGETWPRPTLPREEAAKAARRPIPEAAKPAPRPVLEAAKPAPRPFSPPSAKLRRARSRPNAGLYPPNRLPRLSPRRRRSRRRPRARPRVAAFLQTPLGSAPSRSTACCSISAGAISPPVSSSPGALQRRGRRSRRCSSSSPSSTSA